jgi:hypothetical protein
MVLISANAGTLLSTKGSSVKRHAAINGSAAFLAPEMGISPLSGTPPCMRMASIG